jgi:hypothetical protein
MPDPGNQGDRAKAYRLRKAIDGGKNVPDVDRLWLAEYDENGARRQRTKPGAAAAAAAAAASKHHGRSRSGREIKFELKEAAEAEGTGNAAATAAGLALHAKEEGRRLDSLTINAVDALKEACAVYKDICLTLRERTEILESTHIEMLQSVRGYYIHAMQAEGALMNKETEGDPSTAMLIALVAKHLGIDVPAGAAAAAARRGKRPPANGTAAP